MNFAEKMKENLAPAEEAIAKSDPPPEEVVESCDENNDDRVPSGSPIEEILEDGVPSDVGAEYGNGEEINQKYQQPTMRTIWDEPTGVLGGDSNVKMYVKKLRLMIYVHG
mgnify:CR=1 FL=1